MHKINCCNQLRGNRWSNTNYGLPGFQITLNLLGGGMGWGVLRAVTGGLLYTFRDKVEYFVFYIYVCLICLSYLNTISNSCKLNPMIIRAWNGWTPAGGLTIGYCAGLNTSRHNTRKDLACTKIFNLALHKRAGIIPCPY